jgi:NADPH:quinone reductase-like Zn-dependent oxidoreductase
MPKLLICQRSAVMKAAVIPAPGTDPAYDDFVDPVEEPGRAIVSLVAAGIHPVVRLLAAGNYYASTGGYPQILGVDAVARTEEGAVVYTGYPRPPFGTFAERISVPEGMRFELPDGADPIAVAAGINPGLASWLPLRARRAETGGLGTVLILGATGMAGRLAAQNAVALGARRVVGAGRNRTALGQLEGYGATTVALTDERDANAHAIAAGLGDDAPDLVLDFVWGPVAEAAFAALARRGWGEDNADIAYVEIGAMAGEQASVPGSLLRSRRFRVTGSSQASTAIADVVAALRSYMEMIAAGHVVVPARAYPLSRIGEAWTAASGSSERAVVVPE